MMPNDRTTALRWYVYLLRCGSGALYTGIATDVSRRLAEHREAKGKGAKYLRGRGPLRLVFKKAVGAKGLALSVEGRIKRLPKARKEALIEQDDMIERIIARALTASHRRAGRRSIDRSPAGLATEQPARTVHYAAARNQPGRRTGRA
jgi:putative endonuclease